MLPQVLPKRRSVDREVSLHGQQTWLLQRDIWAEDYKLEQEQMAWESISSQNMARGKNLNDDNIFENKLMKHFNLRIIASVEPGQPWTMRSLDQLEGDFQKRLMAMDYNGRDETVRRIPGVNLHCDTVLKKKYEVVICFFMKENLLFI